VEYTISNHAKAQMQERDITAEEVDAAYKPRSKLWMEIAGEKFISRSS
jgi:hypothetical protein